MDKRSIGSLEVSTIGLGCNNFGSRIDEAQTKEVVDAAIDAGINFFDTADMYGGTLSEEFLGWALGDRRKQTVIATKFGHDMNGVRMGARPEYVIQACEASLRRLGTDFIDLYQLHIPDPNVPLADTLGALDLLVKQGKVREIGCSNFDVALMREAEAAVKPGGAKFVSVQNEMSLLHREPEDGVLDECAQHGIAFLPYFPLFSGLLTGKYRLGRPNPEGTRIKEDSERRSEKNLETVEQLTAFAESKGHSLLELAISWLLAHGPVASVIAGATKPDQVRANVAAGDWVIDDATMNEIASVLS